MKTEIYTPENLKRWTLPDSYCGEHWDEYFVFLGQHRESDSLSRSNYQRGLELIGGESETVLTIRERHWAVGWVEWIAIHESDEEALKKADAIAGRLEAYPVVDEDHWTALEWEEAQSYWEGCSLRERLSLIEGAGVSLFSIRRPWIPPEDNGLIFDRCNG